MWYKCKQTENTSHETYNQNKAIIMILWSIDIRDYTARRRATMHCDQLSSRARSSARLNFADSPAQVCLHHGAAVDSMTTSGVCRAKEGLLPNRYIVYSTVYRNIIYYKYPIYRYRSDNNIMCIIHLYLPTC